MYAILKMDLTADRTVSKCLAVVFFTFVIALSGFIRVPVPMSPVPVTLQTFFVLLAGASLGGVWAGAPVLGYILLGAANLPVFSAAGSGLWYLTGPTGGYIAGFFLAAVFLGFSRRHVSGSYISLLILFAAADSIILWSGIIWLRVLTGYDTAKLFSIGILPFIAGDLLKVAAAAGIYKILRPRLEQCL